MLRTSGFEAKLHAALRYAGAATGVALVGPRVVGLEVTHFCNLSCGFCETHGRFMAAPITKRRTYVGERRTMDLDTIRRLGASLSRIGVDWVELSGKGDPIVHPELPEIVKILKESGLHVSMFTNGSVQRPGLVAALVDNGLENLNLSMNAGTREVFARVTGKDLFEKSVAFVREVLEHRRRRGPKKLPWVRLTTVVCKDNVADMDAQVELCCALGVDEGGWCVMGELRETTDIRLDAGDADVLLARLPGWRARLDAAGIVHDLATFEEDLRMRIGAGPQQDNPIQRAVPCYEGWNHAVISPDGVVAPCCYCENVKLGNVVEQDFEEVWRGEAYQEFRRRSLEMPKTGRAICRECFTSCNRAQMNRTIDQRLHWIGRGGARGSDASAPSALPKPAGG